MADTRVAGTTKECYLRVLTFRRTLLMSICPVTDARERSCMDNVRPPNLGDYLRALRTRSTPQQPGGLTRTEFAAKLYWSVSHITQVERNESAHPSVKFLEDVSRVLSLDPAQRRHLYNLARRTQTERETSTTPWTIDQYRSLVTPEMRTVITALNPHLVAYLDERWNVIECNAAYDRAFPGLLDDGNVCAGSSPHHSPSTSWRSGKPRQP